MKLKLVWVLSLVLLPSYSYCEPYYYGTSGNAASTSLSWGMPSVLPDVAGLDINGLIYRYTTVKNTEDDMLVHVGNHNSTGDGYTFRETDDWSGVPSNTIVKSFALSNIPSDNWGTGFIEVEGEGTVEDAVVIYSYRVDRCYDPQSDPSCSGYVEPIPDIPEVEVYDALEDESVLEAIDADTKFKYDEEGNIIKDEEEEEEDTRIEMGLTASANALTLLRTQGQDSIIIAINQQTNINMYYNAKINGGTMNDAAELQDGTIPDNKKALRNNLAQQILHEQMVDMQYNK